MQDTASTDELRRLTGLSKSGITTFEQAGIIKRSAVNTWPMPDTLVALVTHLRTRKPAISDDHARWERARALREERKAALEARELCWMSDFTTSQSVMTGLVFAGLDATASRLHPTDRAARKRVEEEFTILKACVSTAFQRLADDLTADPVSLMPTDIAAIRQRLFGRPAPLPPP
jgi:hypothetical protein